jgi:hypothetical protein
MEAGETVASHWGNRLANECYFREAPHAASAQPPRPSRTVSYSIGMLTHPAETGVGAILADETMDDPKMESRILLSAVASHRQFEYLERSRRGCGPLPRQWSLPGWCTRAELVHACRGATAYASR